jgi:hypothetical protein
MTWIKRSGDIETGWNSPITEPIRMAVQREPRIVRIPALSGNLS